MQEGHYQFQFNDNKELHQFYFNPNRKRVGESNSWFNKLEEEQVGRSWNNLKVEIHDKRINSSWYDATHIFGNEAKSLNNTWATWNIPKDDMSLSFLDCFGWNHEKHYEDHVKSHVGCQLHRSIEFQDMKCNLSDVNICTCNLINLQNVTCGCTSDLQMEIIPLNSTHIPKENVKVDLLCEIQNGDEIYGFVQPVELISSSIKSRIGTAPIGIAGTSTIVVIAVLVFLILTSSIVVYYRKEAKKKQINTIANLSPSKWVENPDYSGSESADEVDGDPLLPTWLLDRNEMIYDGSCIEKGRRLGGGNFGDVFEGKIRLGNAV